MRIAVCGPKRSQVIKQIENSLNTQVKLPWSIGGKSNIIDYAAETYKYENEVNVVFDGSPFDFLYKSDGVGYDDVYEQIALDTVNNVNYIVVVTEDMDSDVLKVYREYSDFLPGKFIFHNNLHTFEIPMN